MIYVDNTLITLYSMLKPNVCLSYVGQYGHNVKWILLGYTVESATGILEVSKGYSSLRKVETRECYCFCKHVYALTIVST